MTLCGIGPPTALHCAEHIFPVSTCSLMSHPPPASASVPLHSTIHSFQSYILKYITIHIFTVIEIYDCRILIPRKPCQWHYFANYSIFTLNPPPFQQEALELNPCGANTVVHFSEMLSALTYQFSYVFLHIWNLKWSCFLQLVDYCKTAGTIFFIRGT